MRHEAVPSITALPMRIMPFPWEDLASLISRLGEQMGYKNPAWILRPEDIPYVVQPFTLCQLRDKADYRFFEQLLRLDQECLYQLTLHRFASGIQAPERSTDRGESQSPPPQALHLSIVLPSVLGNEGVPLLSLRGTCLWTPVLERAACRRLLATRHLFN